VTDNLIVGGQLGNFLIDSVIGRGGMSVVYGAKHARLGMPVALKVLAPELSSDDTFRARFLREAQMAAGIDHPNVIPIHDMGLHESSLYIVMRYVAGGDLRDLLTTSGPLEAQAALALLMPVALALDAAHAGGLVHRDVKPANILIQRSASGEPEHVYLTDFGIAKSASFDGALTAAGGSIGTVGYMAPEQLGGGEVTPQTDVYALAVTFYECLTGRVPFQRELAEGIRPPLGPLEPLSAVRPDLPGALDEVFATALARDPKERHPTCERFLCDCVEILGDGRAVANVDARALTLTAAPQIAHSPDPAESALEQPPAGSGRANGRHPSKGLARYRRHAALLIALIAGGVAAVVILTSSSGTQKGKLSLSPLAAVPLNHVRGSGEATVRLSGDKALITVTTQGLDNGAELVHLVHIHAGGKGECPPPSAARLHNGHLAISTTDGINYYGAPVQALTTRGDTSVASILVFSRFPSGGSLRYRRTIVLPAGVAAEIRRDNAVVVVHGTDYDGTGIYSGVLDPSELNKGVPGTATAPALCGRLVSAQNAASAKPGSGDGGLLYAARLAVDAGAGLPRELFICSI
jgi:hypothetical protein